MDRMLHFELSFWDIKTLLEELEFCMKFKNRDNTNAKHLFESIVSQVNDRPIVFEKEKD